MCELKLRLFHGRSTPDEQLDGWGTDGPVFPIEGYQCTYGTHRVLVKDEWYDLNQVEDLIEFNGRFYGDFVISMVPETNMTADSVLPIFQRRAFEALMWQWYGILPVDWEWTQEPGQTPQDAAYDYGVKYDLDRVENWDSPARYSESYKIIEGCKQ